MKIVINSDAGKYGLSDLAFERYLAETNQTWTSEVIDGIKRYLNPDKHIIFPEEISRQDPLLIAIVEELAEKSWGPNCRLKVIDLPEDLLDWELLEEREGNETIREKHRIYQ